MPHNKRFSHLLNEGISSVAKRQGKKIYAIENEIAVKLGYSRHTIESFRLRGNVPQNTEHVAFLVRYCVIDGRMPRVWAANILKQADFPNAQTMLQDMFSEVTSTAEFRRIYQNLPFPSGEFIGREGDIDRVLEGLKSRMPVTAIIGFGGEGKTTLAIEVGRRCLPGNNALLLKPFEAGIWISDEGQSDGKEWLNEVLNVVADVLDHPGIKKLPVNEKIPEIGVLLRSQPILLIIDNYESINDPDLDVWIQSVPPPSKVLITSKYAMTGNLWSVRLKGLGESDAVDLIRRQARRLGLEDVELAHEVNLLPLARATKGNPKAIEMSLGYLTSGTVSLREIVEHLNSADGTVGAIFEYLFKGSWTVLDQDARDTLLAAAFFRDSASKESLGWVAGLSEYDLDSAIKELVKMSLLNVCGDIVAGRPRYQLHPLTRAFANSAIEELANWKKAAQERWIMFFRDVLCVTRVHADAGWWATLDQWQNYSNVEEEMENLLKAVDVASTCEMWQQVRDMAVNMVHPLWYTGRPDDRIHVLQQALGAIDMLLTLTHQPTSTVQNLMLDQAWIHADGLGWVYVMQQNHNLAKESLMRGRDIAQIVLRMDSVDANARRDAHDVIALSYRFETMLALSISENIEGKFHEMESTLVGLVETCSLRIRNRILCTLGQLYWLMGRFQRDCGNLSESDHSFQTASSYLEQALTNERTLGVSTETVWDLVWLGEVCLADGRLARARSLADEALYQVHEIGDRVTGAFVDRLKGKLELEEGNETAAKRFLEQSYDTFSRLRLNSEASISYELLSSME